MVLRFCDAVWRIAGYLLPGPTKGTSDDFQTQFVTNVAATTAAVTIVPRHVLGRGFTAPSDRLNIAGIGVGGMGRTNLLNLGLDNNIVALCDVDWGYAGRNGPPRHSPARSEARSRIGCSRPTSRRRQRKNSEHPRRLAEADRAEDLAEASSATPTTA